MLNKIDTYEISIRPHEDCCTIFTPKAPATKPKSYIKRKLFEVTGFDFETLIDECVETAEINCQSMHNYKKNDDIF